MEFEEKKGLLDKEKIINLPDTLFWKLCQDKYGVNKGIYNTIDLWFYNNGQYKLITRRRLIINFLNFTQLNNHKKNMRLKFGHGGLSKKLDEFWKNNYKGNE
ncbi:hypothetical protein [Cytobacillus pseudoceanisediminis]|uniref:hypothetical protein n=1 Tax=Cytobacillus pseudoceanisediminis TaxID=3051614 RepID=UPI003C2C5F27